MMRKLVSTLSLGAALLCGSATLSGCFFFGMPTGDPGAQRTKAQEASLDRYRAEVKAKPGKYAPAAAFAAAAKSLQKAETDLNRVALVDEAVGYLDAVDEEDKKYAALADKGALLRTAGRDKEALEAFQASLADTPNLMVLDDMLPLMQGQSDDIAELCGNLRKGIEREERVYLLMQKCGAAGDSMDWASEEDRETYQAQKAKAAKRRARAAERRRAQRERQRQSFSSPSPSPRRSSGSSSRTSAPAPQRYQARISVYNACKQRVKVFRGRTNGRYTGSGTHGWHSSNSTSSYSLSGDDEICVLAENGDIMSCAKPQDGARMQITKGCSGFSRR